MAINDQINALDPNSLASLKLKTKDNSPEGVRAAARQFEALFMQQVLKSMRDASPQDGMFNSDETRMYQSLLDQQLATQLSTGGKGTGLAAMIEKQLLGAGKGVTPPAGPVPLSPAPVSLKTSAAAVNAAASAAGSAAAARIAGSPARAGVATQTGQAAAGKARTATQAAASTTGGSGNGAGQASSAGSSAGAGAVKQSAPAAVSGPRAFIDRVWPHAVAASKETGIPAHFLVAQAALETGWGRSEIRTASGEPTHNLFNIKAGRNWSGATASVRTSEYAGGAARSENAQFRAYASEAEAFADYARMIRNNPRYAAVVGKSDAAGFAHGLQAAGYATDPGYAEKLRRIIGGGTLRTALADAAAGTRSV
ncbi:MAG: flagellar assembly peptidoglycan hydrolase FlgJ [Zoogloea sp.]|nr:flagellar assembly peptidoglycan hydrolase FlgJ [Zoogloea sp.]